MLTLILLCANKCRLAVFVLETHFPTYDLSPQKAPRYITPLRPAIPLPQSTTPFTSFSICSTPPQITFDSHMPETVPTVGDDHVPLPISPAAASEANYCRIYTDHYLPARTNTATQPLVCCLAILSCSNISCDTFLFFFLSFFS